MNRILPKEQACVRLVSTLVVEMNQEWMERIYLGMGEGPQAATAEEAAA